MERKYCRHCETSLERSSFFVSKAAKDGLQNRCKECQSKIRKKYYLKNSKKILDNYRSLGVSNELRKKRDLPVGKF